MRNKTAASPSASHDTITRGRLRALRARSLGRERASRAEAPGHSFGRPRPGVVKGAFISFSDMNAPFTTPAAW